MEKLLHGKIIGLVILVVLSMVIYAQEPDTLAPAIVDGPQLEDIEATSVIVVWKTDEPSTGTVHYGKGSNLNKVDSSNTLGEEHEVTLSKLEPATTYYFRLSVIDSIGNGPYVSELDSFTTKAGEPDDPDEDLPAIKIIADSGEVFVGDTVWFRIVYADTNGLEIDTVAQWSVWPDSLGSIDANGLFIAEQPGECIVRAELDTLSDWLALKIDTMENEEPGGEEYNHLVILPRDTIITLGTRLQLEVYYQSDSGGIGTLIDSAVEWSQEGMSVGEISDDGLFTATDLGFTLVTARLEERFGSSFIIVSDSTLDTTLNTITITRSSPNPQGYSVVKSLSEGQRWMIGGLPHPMNILNGGGVYFPVGCLTEDIRIHIDLPGFAVIGPDRINFSPQGVVGGVDFEVMVNDTIMEPYYFESPLIVGIVYKRGLLSKLGIDPLSLSLYFATMENDSVIFDTSGIGYTTMDLTHNKILSSVAHFSSLVVRGETGTVVASDKGNSRLPSQYALNQNYPNPFNPTTTITFSIPERTAVRIVVYDLLGNRVRTLLDREQTAGKRQIVWDGTDRYGREVSAGIYLYRLRTPTYSATKKMILVK